MSCPKAEPISTELRPGVKIMDRPWYPTRKLTIRTAMMITTIF